MKNKIGLMSSFVVVLSLILSPVSFVQAQAPDSLPAQALEHMPVCPPTPGPNAGVRCHAQVVVEKNGKPQKTPAPIAAYGPAQLRGAYGLASAALVPSTQAIAIVDAYDQPNIKSDLDFYNAFYGLPNFPSCTDSTPTGCFKKLDQNGGTAYPAVNPSWSLETSLDVEAAHAVCPNCTIVLVEANSASYGDLLAAEDTAANSGANVISNSWGSAEFSSESTFDFHFNHPGVAITFSTGDAGYGTEYPAASPFVTAVGGTSLTLNADNTRKAETAWSGSGSGCSAYEVKPSFQTDTGCLKRMIADVSAVADPGTGAAVYDTVTYNGVTGWFKVGGTSLASPIIAAVYALSANTTSVIPANGYPYSYKTGLNDITSGSNGSCARSTIYFCTSVTGYDGPTGLGTPKGIIGF
jgi:subtilase family serine protease